MGTRGIPANYGGFETFAEELSTRLAQRGHDVTVYGRSNIIDYTEPVYHGVKIKLLPTWSHKYFDTVAHTWFSVLHGARDFDVILICNSVNALFALYPRFWGTKVVLNVDGLEWQRAKWNKAGQWVYRISEFLATFLPNQIVSDSIFVQNYYLSRFKKPSTFIPYGCPVERVETQDILKKYNLQSRNYLFYVSRLEPENNAHVVVRAYEQVETDMPLVIVGDAPYNSQYIQELKSTKDKRIIFTGYVFGQGYREFQSHAYAYIQATEVGGTHPALLEGMGYGNCVIVNDVPEHREVVQDCGLYYQGIHNLSDQMRFVLENPKQVERYRKAAADLVRIHYSWEAIVEKYEQLFYKMI